MRRRAIRYVWIACAVFFSIWAPGNRALADSLTTDDIHDILAGHPYYSYTAQSCDLSGDANLPPVSSTLPDAVPEPHRTLFTQAASAFNTNPQYIAALFLTENGNIWKNFDTSWPTSGAGAIGPMQFLTTTWGAYGVDGNNDGVADIRNIYDAVYSAANMAAKNGVTTGSPLGDLNAPFRHTTPKTMLFAAAAYNWGPGNIDRKTTDTSTLEDPDLSKEVVRYVKNVYGLVTSGFTKSGIDNYGDPRPDGAPSNGGGGVEIATYQECATTNGVVAGNIVATALNLAWNTKGHGKDKEDAKPTYQEAMPKYNGSRGNDEFSDCGVFVSTVIIASQAEPNYPRRGTGIQLDYIRSHPDKFLVLDSVTSTSQLNPGDIFVYNDGSGGHTIVYTGPQPGNYNAVDASWHGHVPQAKTINVIDPKYTIARIK